MTLSFFGRFLAIPRQRTDSHGLLETVLVVTLGEGHEVFVREYNGDPSRVTWVVAEVPYRANPPAICDSAEGVEAALAQFAQDPKPLGVTPPPASPASATAHARAMGPPLTRAASCARKVTGTR